MQGGTGAASTVAGPQGVAGVAGSTGAASTVAGPQGVAGVAGAAGAAAPYVIGAIGPAGGIIFMTPTSAGNTTGKYFEAAPADLSTLMAWCSNTTGALGGTGTAIGTGEANTTAMASCTSGAAFSASAYSYGTSTIYTDWFLPSLDELNQLCKYARSQSYSVPGTVCPPGISNNPIPSGHNDLRRFGFGGDGHWSSSENNASTARGQDFIDGFPFNASGKSTTNHVRPVRAFTP